MAKYTKSQQKRLAMQIRMKTFELYKLGIVTIKDVEMVDKMSMRAMKKI